ncbi:TRAP transporter substrate-binding protein DctP [Pseudomonas sp. Teo4]|uniref:TRAP transporter substrate-binding protein n=1 Tax=Pseudomonas sp. Teo4 TaxID=3064528 RepID=UPI002ABC656B|nr:TRAP transporter substrate-binding protein DctP [Pseudomonas sp. Teo4]MDZ3992242.1 Solute-binding protein [Pseudomonas sp. Teo4]
MLVNNRTRKPGRLRRLLQASLLVTAVAGTALPAFAQTPLTLKFAHRFSSKHYLWTDAGAVFTEQVKQASNGRIAFELYPAGQLGKDYFSLLRSGLADIAIFIPSYESEKLPMSSVAELPGMYANACEGTRRYWKLARPAGVLGEGEFARQGLHVLFVAAMPPYTLMTTRKPITRLDEVQGLKLRSTGASMIKTAQALGGVPVQIPSSETYEALSRGTVDGAIFLHYGLPPYNLEDLTRYAVDGVNLGGGVIAFAISQQAWAKLPTDIQAVMTQAAQATQETFCQGLDEDDRKIREDMVKHRGHQVAQLTPAEISRWNDKLKQVIDAWLADMQAVGQDGKGVLKTFQGTNGQEI